MRLPAAPALFLAIFAACSSAGDADTGSSVARAAPKVGTLDFALASSEQKTQVPRDLLVAIAHVEEGLTIPATRLTLDVDSDVPAAGPLQLRRGKLDTLKRAAELSGHTELELRQDADRALEAGALVLAELGTKTSATPSDLTSWRDAIAEMSGYSDDAHRERYVHQVFAVLARGGSFAARGGETIELSPHDIPPSLTIDLDTNVKMLAQAEYPAAEWIPTSCSNNKCDSSHMTTQYVVIHDTEGSWNASVATLQNDGGKSVQYIVGTDGRVAQFVTEETTAYHAGNYYVNQRSVGIEHVGYSTQPYTEEQYAASAKLVDYLLTKYNLPRDRAHVIGHDQVPGGSLAQSSPPCSDSPKGCESNTNYGGSSHHTDPGVWEWATYMQRVNGVAKCNDATSILNCSNDRTKAYRCMNNDVQVMTCRNSCIVQAIGIDDTCDAMPDPPPTEPPTTPTTPPTTSPNKTTPNANGGEEPADPTPSSTGAGASPRSSRNRPELANAGCSVTSGGAATSGAGFGAAALALAAMIRRRKTTARTS